MAKVYRVISFVIICTVLYSSAYAQGKIGLDINGGALIHTQKTAVYGSPVLKNTIGMGGAGAVKVTYQAKHFEIGPYGEYGGMQQSAYFLLGGTANALIPLTDFQLYVGATGGYAGIGSETGASIGVQAGGRFPIFSNLHFNTELSYRRVNAGIYEFNAFGIMAGFHVKF